MRRALDHLGSCGRILPGLAYNTTLLLSEIPPSIYSQKNISSKIKSSLLPCCLSQAGSHPSNFVVVSPALILAPNPSPYPYVPSTNIPDNLQLSLEDLH